MKSKNTATITFHASHNCGSFMQAYALQTFLHNSGYNNEIINFSNYGQQQVYAVKAKNDNPKNILKNVILLPHRRILNETFYNYENFINSNLKLTQQKFSTDEELQKYPFIYDTYISGSDQIWNITLEDGDDAYFLDFVHQNNTKRIAYAPSFGAKSIKKHTNDNQYKHYKQLLAKYNFLSSREKNGQKWLKDMLDIEVPVVLDPTLLLTRDDYKQLEQPYDSKVKPRYIFYYSPAYDHKINQLVKKIAKKYQLQVVVWNPKNYYLKGMNLSGFHLAQNQSPGVYLSLIRDATLVITTSFHGTIFSSIYQKNFWTIRNGGMFRDDDRVQTLIDQLKINDRLIPIKFNLDFDYMQNLDYTAYHTNLRVLKKKSEGFLRKALEK